MVMLNRISTSPYQCETGAVPLERVANAEKLLPRDFMDNSGSLPNEKFKEYALPLVGEAWQPASRLEKYRIKTGIE